MDIILLAGTCLAFGFGCGYLLAGAQEIERRAPRIRAAYCAMERIQDQLHVRLGAPSSWPDLDPASCKIFDESQMLADCEEIICYLSRDYYHYCRPDIASTLQLDKEENLGQ